MRKSKKVGANPHPDVLGRMVGGVVGGLAPPPSDEAGVVARTLNLGPYSLIQYESSI